MEKFIQPRGTGKTYSICKYALQHDCDIVSPTYEGVRHCVDMIKQVCMYSNKYIYSRLEGDLHSASVYLFDTCAKNVCCIKVYTAVSYSLLDEEYKKKPIVIDDIDECFKRLLDDSRIEAWSVSSYDPAEVSLKGHIYNG